MGNSYEYENSKDIGAKLNIYIILDKGEKGESGVLDFKSENGQFTGS